LPFEQLLRNNAADAALLIGNGINRYNNDNGTNSWEALLAQIANSCAPGMARARPDKQAARVTPPALLRSDQSHHRVPLRWTRTAASPLFVNGQFGSSAVSGMARHSIFSLLPGPRSWKRRPHHLNACCLV